MFPTLSSCFAQQKKKLSHYSWVWTLSAPSKQVSTGVGRGCFLGRSRNLSVSQLIMGLSAGRRGNFKWFPYSKLAKTLQGTVCKQLDFWFFNSKHLWEVVSSASQKNRKRFWCLHQRLSSLLYLSRVRRNISYSFAPHHHCSVGVINELTNKLQKHIFTFIFTSPVLRPFTYFPCSDLAGGAAVSVSYISAVARDDCSENRMIAIPFHQSSTPWSIL